MSTLIMTTNQVANVVNIMKNKEILSAHELSSSCVTVCSLWLTHAVTAGIVSTCHHE